MIKQTASPTARAPWPCDRALNAWELTAESEMRVEHAVDYALARIARGVLPDFETDALLEPPLPAEPGEPGFGVETSTPRASGIDAIECDAAPEPSERASAVVPLPVAARNDQSHGSRRTLLWGGLGLVLSAAAVLALWIRPSSEPEEAGPRPAAVTQASAPGASPSVTEATAAAAPVVTETRPTSAATLGEVPARAEPAMKQRGTRTARRTAKPATTHVAASEPQPSPQESPTPEAGMKPAEQGVNLVDHPSAGELHASLSKVLPAASRCLAAGQTALPVAITFLGAGAVSSVIPKRQVSPSEQSCVVRTLSQARVAPFARPDYRIEATVRPSQ